MRDTIEIAGRPVGPGHPVYVIAEVSANHNGDFSKAAAIVEAAAAAGADAVKLQTYTPDTLTIRCSNDWFRIRGTPWDGRTLHELYGEAQTPWEWQPELKRLAERLHLHCFSTPFDATAVSFLSEMGVPAFKIASFENTDLPLLRRVAATGKPVILSTGMATLGEMEEAVGTLESAGCRELAILKCTSAYPAPPEEMNLRTIPHLRETFRVPVGLSDHTLGPVSAVAATALGASVVEKHLTLSRADPGPDSAFSTEPEEFRDLVRAIRETERALGTARYGAGGREKGSMVFRRSLFVVEDVKKGEILGPRNVRVIRPGYGLHSRHLEEVLGRPASRDIARGTPLSWDLVGSGEKR